MYKSLTGHMVTYTGLVGSTSSYLLAQGLMYNTYTIMELNSTYTLHTCTYTVSYLLYFIEVDDLVILSSIEYRTLS